MSKASASYWRTVPLLIIMLLGCVVAAAAVNGSFRPGNGVKQLDLLGDGTPAMTVIGKRENFNAHSFDVMSLFVQIGDQWELVPFFDAEKEQDVLTSSGGADCLLHDFRFVRQPPGKPLELVIADRDDGDSFIAERPVTFRLYQLTRNVDSLPGAPTWSFQLKSTRKSAHSYCDVGDALARESIWIR